MSDETKRRQLDPELQAMSRITRELADLEADARGRVMSWVISRQAADEAARAKAMSPSRVVAIRQTPADSEGGEA